MIQLPRSGLNRRCDICFVNSIMSSFSPYELGGSPLLKV